MYSLDFPTLNENDSLFILTEEEEDKFNELWEEYVPDTGPAKTENSEFLRIVGRVNYELLNNGGGNDKSMEILYLNEMLKHGKIPDEMKEHVHFVNQFLYDKSQDYSRRENDYEKACAYSFELIRFAMTKFNY